MLRGRWIGLISLLVLLGAGGGYWLAHRDAPGPVLHTVTVGAEPGWVAVDERTGHAFVTNTLDATVSVLDARDGTVLRTIVLDQRPTIVADDAPTGRVFVLGDDSNTVSVLDAASGALLSTVAVPTADLAVDAQTGRVFVAGITSDTTAGSGTLAILDGRTGRVLHTTTLAAPGAWGLAIDPRAGRVFVANFADDTVSDVDASSGRVSHSVAVGSVPAFVAADATTGHVFVTNNGDDTVTMLEGRSGRVLRTIRVGPAPARVVEDQRTGRVFIVHGRGGPFALATFGDAGHAGTTVLDARTGAVLASLAAGGSPFDQLGYSAAANIAVDERRSRVFVINHGAATRQGGPTGGVSVLDAVDGRLLRTIAVGRHPISLAVDGEAGRLFVVNTNSGCVTADPFKWMPSGIRGWLPLIPRPPKPNCDLPGNVTVIDTTHL